MNGQKTDRRWQLQETESRGKQWNLLDSEQDLDERWQLQRDEEYANHEDYNWQPIENLPEERTGSANWVLPSLVLVAVLAVAGYVAVTGLDRIGLSGLDISSLFSTTPSEVANNQNSGNTGEPQVTSSNDAATAAQTPADLQPTVTEIPPTATATLVPPTATPAITVEKRVATVREQYGVNARSDPSTAGDPVEVVAQGTQLPIWEAQTNGEGDWYQVSLPNKSLAWVAAAFVDVTATSVTYDEMNQSRQEFGLPLLPTPTSAAPVAVEPAPAATATEAQPANSIETAGLAATAAISSPLGLNLRSAADSTSDTITLLADSLVFPVVGRSADGQWLQLQLTDGTLGWAASQFLRIEGDLTQLPAGGVSEAPSTSSPISSTSELTTPGAVTTTESVTTTGEITSTVAVDQATATVTFLSGSRVRQEPQEESGDLAVLDFGAEMKAIGRTEDGTFIQVELSDGSQGWVTPNTVELNVAVDSLPIVQ